MHAAAGGRWGAKLRRPRERKKVPAQDDQLRLQPDRDPLTRSLLAGSGVTEYIPRSLERHFLRDREGVVQGAGRIVRRGSGRWQQQGRRQTMEWLSL